MLAVRIKQEIEKHKPVGRPPKDDEQTPQKIAELNNARNERESRSQAAAITGTNRQVRRTLDNV